MTLLMIGATELIIIALLALLLFGGKKLPELMRGLGSGVKNFKDGMNGIIDGKPEEIKSEVVDAKTEDAKTENQQSNGSK
ncbi:MAG: twin-arginine translocase TatA/TatE family subunit [Bacteroidales bacterium]|nr:twin-arginine translocase TatA/TatE family subunit [Bacteroidales bacterium]